MREVTGCLEVVGCLTCHCAGGLRVQQQQQQLSLHCSQAELLLLQLMVLVASSEAWLQSAVVLAFRAWLSLCTCSRGCLQRGQSVRDRREEEEALLMPGREGDKGSSSRSLAKSSAVCTGKLPTHFTLEPASRGRSTTDYTA